MVSFLIQIENLLLAYLDPEFGDRVIKNATKNNDTDLVTKLATEYHLNKRQSLILEYAIINQQLTIEECEHILPQISRRTIQRDISKMTKQNLLTVEGQTNNRCYKVSSLIAN